MAYEKQNWKTGDVVTSAKLNHIEDGIAGGGGVLVVKAPYDEISDSFICEKTAGEIVQALTSGTIVFIVIPATLEELQDGGTYLSSTIVTAEITQDGYNFLVCMMPRTIGADNFFRADTWFEAATANDYPSLHN